MSWQSIEISNEDASAFTKAFQKASRFLVDENLGPEVAPVLRSLGYDATDTFALMFNGRSDEDVFSAASKEHRIVFTRGRRFLDDRRTPARRMAGVVILLGSHHKTLITALMYALSVVGKGRDFWEGTKIVVGDDGRFTVSKDNQAGARRTIHYKLRIGGPPLIWRADEGSCQAPLAAERHSVLPILRYRALDLNCPRGSANDNEVA